MVMLLLTRQPTIRRANTSMTKATYSQPCQVETSVKSEPHSWLGRSGLDHPIDPIQRTRRALSGTVVLTTLPRLTPSSLFASSAARRCNGYRHTFALELTPDIVGTVHPHVGLPDPLNLRHQRIVALVAVTAQIGIAPAGSMSPVGGRGNLQHRADRPGHAGSTPQASRCWSIESLTTSVCGRAPPERKKRWPS